MPSRRPRLLAVSLALLAGLLAVTACVAAASPAAAAPAPPATPAAPAPPATPAVPAPPAKWTVMVYMCGDNNLEKWVSHDIDKEMAAVGSSEDVQVVVLADRTPGYSTADGDWTGTLVFNVTKGMKATPDQAVADWGERDMGSPQTLIDFVTWTRANYPAERYALFLWDHGWGWWPGNTMQDRTSNDYLDMHELRHALEA
ncbi:MAG TPA: clostripain-related cysteine peptidase, partial [Thermoleophilia bacterium]|nr:clostripain-related cysteine peptidase [Thermoleophilia bacterium]